jgi:hypothetical protein
METHCARFRPGLRPRLSAGPGPRLPELGPGTAPDLLTDLQVKLVTTGNKVDLANELNDVIYKLQIEKLGISYAELTDVLIAAYCPAVATTVNLTASEKLSRMRAFDTTLQQQLAANMTPPGTEIIANFRFRPPFTASCEARRQASERPPRN